VKKTSHMVERGMLFENCLKFSWILVHTIKMMTNRWCVKSFIL